VLHNSKVITVKFNVVETEAHNILLTNAIIPRCIFVWGYIIRSR